jgi:uncharacterized membrane protein
MIIKYPHIHPYIDTIIGTNAPMPMMDWFPLNRWIPVLLAGLIVGQNLIKNEVNIPILEFNNIITDIGKNSLNLYTAHVTALLVFYKLLNNHL